MIKAIIVDDERPALERFNRILSEDKRVQIEGTFTSPSEALEYVKNNNIDAAFLDIEMPGIGGLEFASHIKNLDSEIKIIFVTAYDCYALDAFKLHAFGYIMKPVERSELKEQIDLLCNTANNEHSADTKKLCVRCLGDFCVIPFSQDTSDSIKWKTLKAEELFALLIHYRGVPVPKDVLIDKLWPDAEPQKSANLFRVTCTYIRHTLSKYGFTNALVRELNKYKIDISIIDCDLFRFEDTATDVPSLSAEKLHEALSLYKGDYFQSMPYDWAMQKRVSLEIHFKNLSHKCAELLAMQNNYTEAAQILSGILNFDPYDYNAAISFVKLKIKSGDNDAALHFYREFTSRLIRETGDAPPSSLADIIDQ